MTLSLLLFGLLAFDPAHASTLDGSCDANPRVRVVQCTLRAAIQEANRFGNPGPANPERVF
jgi:CSLREA domain-containing protein